MASFCSEELKTLRDEAWRPDRLYPLVSHGWSYRFYTGHLPDGKQTIVFWDGPEQAVFLLFEPDGTYLATQVRALPPMPIPPEEWPKDDQPVHRHFREQFGFLPGQIRVKRFEEAEWQISIEPLHKCQEEFVADPMGFAGGDEEEFADQLEGLREWIRERQFVFNCGNDFWVDDGGVVVTS